MDGKKIGYFSKDQKWADDERQNKKENARNGRKETKRQRNSKERKIKRRIRFSASRFSVRKILLLFRFSFLVFSGIRRSSELCRGTRSKTNFFFYPFSIELLRSVSYFFFPAFFLFGGSTLILKNMTIHSGQSALIINIKY